MNFELTLKPTKFVLKREIMGWELAPYPRHSSLNKLKFCLSTRSTNVLRTF